MHLPAAALSLSLLPRACWLQVLQVLTGCGYRGPLIEGLLDGLLLLASDGSESQGLLGLLSQGDAAQLLQRVTEVMALVGSSTV